MNDLGLIFFENPISRCYLNICKKNNYKFKYILALNSNSFLPNTLLNIYNYYKMNHHALKFTNKKKFKSIINEIENFFNYENNFFNEMYKYRPLEEFSKSVDYLNTFDINSAKVIEKLLSKKNLFFLNTGNKIYKKTLDHDLKIIHIHPGYLPNIRGADASLWNIDKLKSLGSTSFLINKKIDTGKILKKIKYKLPKFYSNEIINLDVMDIYRFWFSFIDPIIRGKHFENTILNIIKTNDEKIYNNNLIIKNEDCYYTFMNNEKKIEIFKKVFT